MKTGSKSCAANSHFRFTKPDELEYHARGAAEDRRWMWVAG